MVDEYFTSITRILKVVKGKTYVRFQSFYHKFISKTPSSIYSNLKDVDYELEGSLRKVNNKCKNNQPVTPRQELQETNNKILTINKRIEKLNEKNDMMEEESMMEEEDMNSIGGTRKRARDTTTNTTLPKSRAGRKAKTVNDYELQKEKLETRSIELLNQINELHSIGNESIFMGRDKYNWKETEDNDEDEDEKNDVWKDYKACLYDFSPVYSLCDLWNEEGNYTEKEIMREMISSILCIPASEVVCEIFFRHMSIAVKKPCITIIHCEKARMISYLRYNCALVFNIHKNNGLGDFISNFDE